MATENKAQIDDPTVSRPQVLIALTFGAVLTLVGLTGVAIGGTESELFGLFGRNYVHDAIHLLTGVAGLAAGAVAGGAMSDAYNKYLGAVYLLVFVLGSVALAAGLTSLTGLINLNWADNVLHLLLGVVLVGVGYGVGRQ